ncbi:hypothetical protein Dsin_032473 [Dipteronia sinensis]|uniref:Bifunctional inhibitor/plant lipid transfer protein/seed storage helical domain-containing protein n=1 Tax=Dipteronia sinensis TaxID=43782 RepID=A0AAD9ZNF7_9ROSI|nr:hypothetical protein Dsin_032473 [Dipteronia sinensis]
MVATTLILGDRQVSAQVCGLNIPQLILQCSQYVQPRLDAPSSEECCAVVKSIYVMCACKYVTPCISMDRAVYVG